MLGWDPLRASLILLDIVSHGFSSLVLGSATIKIRVPAHVKASILADELMAITDGSIIVLKGLCADVDTVTFEEFELGYSSGIPPYEDHRTIGVSSLLLLVQFLLQLLLTPLCTFFGQIMPLASFVASGGYHLYVASHEREKIHRELLFQNLSTRMDKRNLGMRTQMAVFTCLVLGSDNHQYLPMSANPDAVFGLHPTERYPSLEILEEESGEGAAASLQVGSKIVTSLRPKYPN